MPIDERSPATLEKIERETNQVLAHERTGLAVRSGGRPRAVRMVSWQWLMSVTALPAVLALACGGESREVGRTFVGDGEVMDSGSPGSAGVVVRSDGGVRTASGAGTGGAGQAGNGGERGGVNGAMGGEAGTTTAEAGAAGGNGGMGNDAATAQGGAAGAMPKKDGGAVATIPCGVDVCDLRTETCGANPNADGFVVCAPKDEHICVGGCLVADCDGPEDCAPGEACVYYTGENDYFVCSEVAVEGVLCIDAADCSTERPYCRSIDNGVSDRWEPLLGWRPRACFAEP